MPSTGKSSVCLELHSTFVREYNIFKRSVTVAVVGSPSKPLHLVGVSYKLTVGAASEGPSELRTTSQDSATTYDVAMVSQQLMQLNCRCFIITLHLFIHNSFYFWCDFRRSTRTWPSVYGVGPLVLRQELPYTYATTLQAFLS